MATAKKKCRVCGQQYEACKSAKRPDGAFVWREVACSPNCGSVYLERIIASRKPAAAAIQTAVIEVKEPPAPRAKADVAKPSKSKRRRSG